MKRHMRMLSLSASMLAAALTAILLGAAPQKLRAQADSQVSLDLHNVTLETALNEIAKQSGVVVSYSKDKIPVNTRVTVKVVRMPAIDALRQALLGTGVQMSTTAGGQVVLSATRPAAVAEGVVRGRVVDALTGEALAGTDVQIVGTVLHTRTDGEGKYILTRVPPGRQMLSVRRVGYARTQIPVTVPDDGSVTVDCKLRSTPNTLDQVVVSGTIVATAEKALPSPITVITAKDIETHGITRVSDLFRGLVPGIVAQDIGPTAEFTGTSLFVRGGSSFSPMANGMSANAIKTYIDGIEVTDPTLINNIDPNSIDRIEILRGPQASTVYGSNAINGVMQIFTKNGTLGTNKNDGQLTLSGGRVNSNAASPGAYQQDHSFNVNGSSGHLSYSGTLSYSYLGPWTPGYRTQNYGGTVGGRMDEGPVTAAVSLRLNRRDLTTGQSATTQFREATGVYTYSNFDMTPMTTQYTRDQQTLGATLTYSPAKWWQNSLTAGRDENDLDRLDQGPRYRAPTDSLQTVSAAEASQTTYNYNSSFQLHPTSLVAVTAIVGADHWNSLSNSVSTSSNTQTGTLGGSPTVTRNTDHNTGYFAQLQPSIADRFFLTAGLRAEDNPNFGNDVGLVYTGRLGASYVAELGELTLKPRLSWGRATRPPTLTQKNGSVTSTTLTLPNPDLQPEQQVGVDGGFDLFLGNLFSFSATRYDQMVNNMILTYQIGQAPALPITTYIYQNIGRVQNRGWELEASAQAGPLNFRGSYSALDSRIRKVNAFYIGTYKVGDKLRNIASTTTGLSINYAVSRTSVTLDINRLGASLGTNQAFADQRTKARLFSGSATASPVTFPPFTRYNLNATHDIVRQVALFASITNLFNNTTNDWTNNIDVIGRQSMVGLRLRF